MYRDSFHSWLSQPPKYTIFRVNTLKSFETDLKEILEAQNITLKAPYLPKFHLLKPDCLILEQWPTEVTTDKASHEIIVDPSCAAAVLRGAHVFAPGVMALPPNCIKGEIVDIFGDLEGKCKRGLKTLYNGKKKYVGKGYLKMVRKDLFDNGVQPSGIAVHTILPASLLPVINETAFPKGVVLLQNMPSLVCGWVVNAQPNESILDMCAAPGNKTTHLAEMSNNRAFIIAIDKTSQKVARIENMCDKQGVTCVRAYVYDSTCCCDNDRKSIEEEPPFPPNSFDKILLDAPCSGLGQRPMLVNKMTPKMLQSYKFVQRKLITAASKLLKEGGRLVYSTCTVTVDENEAMVAWALEKLPELRLIPAEPLLGGPGLPDSGLTDQQRSMVQRFGPDIDKIRDVEPLYRDSIGFFIAAFTKAS